MFLAVHLGHPSVLLSLAGCRKFSLQFSRCRLIQVITLRAMSIVSPVICLFPWGEVFLIRLKVLFLPSTLLCWCCSKGEDSNSFRKRGELRKSKEKVLTEQPPKQSRCLAPMVTRLKLFIASSGPL